VNCKSIIALGLGCLSIGILLPSFPKAAEAQPVFKSAQFDATRIQTSFKKIPTNFPEIYANCSGKLQIGFVAINNNSIQQLLFTV
jgi:hypothetical protein